MLSLQALAGNSAVAGLLRARQATKPAAALQRYKEVDAAQGNATEMLGQEKFAATQQGQKTSFMRNDQVRVEGKTGGKLLVSEGDRMAMEKVDVATRQAKTFFAEPALVNESNTKLKEVGSKMLLDVEGGKQVTVPTGGGPKALDMVVPKDRGTGRRGGTTTGNRGDQVGVAAHCNAVASSIAGDVDALPMKLADANLSAIVGSRSGNSDEKLAAYVTAHVTTNGNTQAKKAAGEAAAKGAANGQITLEEMSRVGEGYGKVSADATKAGLFDAVSSQLGINLDAAPGVGDAFATISLGKQEQGKMRDEASGQLKSVSEAEIWGTHFGSVVAKDGPDVMTFQNYSRAAEGKDVTGQGDQTPGSDARFFFQMYGPARRDNGDGTVSDQSWHTAWKSGARGFANPLTYVMGTAQTPAGLTGQAQAVLAKGKQLGIISDGEETELRERQTRWLTPAQQDALLTLPAPKPSLGRKLVMRVGGDDTLRRVERRIEAAQAVLLREAIGVHKSALGYRKEFIDLGISSFHPEQSKKDDTMNLGERLTALRVPKALVTADLGLTLSKPKAASS